MTRVLLIEDDRALARSLERGLREEGLEPLVVHDGVEGLARLETRASDVCVLDGGLPKLDGFEVLRKARAGGVATPILILTARDTTEDRVRGLNLGADDYLVKPFAFEELLARLRALLRRTAASPARDERITRAGDLEIDHARRRVRRGQETLELSALQFDLLALLATRAGDVFSRETILKELWGYDFDPGTNVVDVHIASLRHRIDRPGMPSCVRTVRGVGYALAEES